MEQHLRRLLDEISGAIGHTGRHEDREELTRLHGEVEGQLERSDEKEQSGLVNALEKAEIQLESDHPSLGASIRQAVQSLTAGGI